jgi:DNA mismatch repair ATPase MutS
VQVVVKARRVYCSTEELVSLNDKQADAFAEINSMTERVLEGLLACVRKHAAWLHDVSEGVALVDMLLAFANHVSLSDGYCRPLFRAGAGEPLALKNARHPLLEAIKKDELVPNDCFLHRGGAFQVITGPNCAVSEREVGMGEGDGRGREREGEGGGGDRREGGRSY